MFIACFCLFGAWFRFLSIWIFFAVVLVFVLGVCLFGSEVLSGFGFVFLFWC